MHGLPQVPPDGQNLMSAYDAVDRKVKAMMLSDKVGAIQVGYKRDTDTFTALIVHDDHSQPLEGEGDTLYFAVKAALDQHQEPVR